ncbi:MAG: hypothetical protein A4E30_00324 [Methanomassiliicoccales archaeon PtaB.Bin215]|nr:MAG: hypothetical protein A4E30_00324 [Methanomassiliicoccales archaeon PtaB.Bin215]
MSATLDLAGGTTTLSDDQAASYLKVTNSVAGGHLILSPGSSMTFDDTSGAGFDPAALGYDITINGTASSHCVIKSASDTPTNAWAAPPVTIPIMATRCDIYNYSGNLGSGYTSLWTFTNCNLFPFETKTEPRTLIANLLTAQWTLATVPEFRDDDERRMPQGLTPLIKVYPLNSPSTLKGRGETQRIEHHLTASIRCRDQDNAFAAKEEVCRILDYYLDHPFTGYDLMTHQDGAYRGGSTWLFQWDVEITLYQLRKVVVRR